jgi:hypothetical protein
VANWYGVGRSNYFRVKDRAEFDRAMDGLEVEVHEHHSDPGLLCVFGNDEYGAFPSNLIGPSDEDVEVDVPLLIGQHLAEGSVAIFQEVGNEKRRYVTGWAVAVNSKGETANISLDDIYDAARKLGTEVTQCSM